MKKIWIDTDPDVDDTAAMAMLFKAKLHTSMFLITEDKYKIRSCVADPNDKDYLCGYKKNPI